MFVFVAICGGLLEVILETIEYSGKQFSRLADVDMYKNEESMGIYGNGNV